MRQKGRLNFYQDINNFERERDTGEDYADIDQAKCYCYDLTAEMTPGVESDNPEYYE